MVGGGLAVTSCSLAALFILAVVSWSQDMFKAVCRVNASSVGQPAFNIFPRGVIGTPDPRRSPLEITSTHLFSSKLQFIIFPFSYLQIAKMHPLIIPPFTNKTLHRAFIDYLDGGDRKKRIVEKYGEISTWDTSKVTNMYELFHDARSFNQPLNNWDVSKVTNMAWMFAEATSFNQPLNNWNVSKVTNMDRMFASANSFNHPLNNWDVSNVTDMGEMFNGATSFNQPLDNWNVSNVTDMVGMFESTRFNQPRHAPWYHSSEESEDESDVDSDSE